MLEYHTQRALDHAEELEREDEGYFIDDVPSAEDVPGLLPTDGELSDDEDPELQEPGHFIVFVGDLDDEEDCEEDWDDSDYEEESEDEEYYADDDDDYSEDEETDARVADILRFNTLYPLIFDLSADAAIPESYGAMSYEHTLLTLEDPEWWAPDPDEILRERNIFVDLLPDASDEVDEAWSVKLVPAIRRIEVAFDLSNSVEDPSQ